MSDAKKTVDQWNRDVPVGSGVYVVLDDGRVRETWTRAKAQVHSDGTAVVWLNNMLGTFTLDRVKTNGRQMSLI